MTNIGHYRAAAKILEDFGRVIPVENMPILRLGSVQELDKVLV